MPAHDPATTSVPTAPASNDAPASSTGHWRMAEHWPELVSAITEQSIESVSLLLRGLDLLMHKGRITPAEYKVLAQPAERLKHVGMHAQQIVRFQSGRVRQSHEKMDLAYLLECVLQERRGELAMLGITVWRKFQPADVLIDPTLGFSLTKAMLDWSSAFGHRIDLRLELQAGTPALARLWMKTHTDHPPSPTEVFEDGIHWLLLRQIAATDGGIEVERNLGPDGVVLTALFRRTLAQPIAPPATQSADETLESSFKSISGAHVLVVSPDTATRQEAVDIIHKLGITAEGVDSVQQAQNAMQRRSPQLLVIDMSPYPGPEAQTLREALSFENPLPIIEIGAPGSTATERDDTHSSIPRDQLYPALGSAVMFTLSKVM